ncbi:uncharacterized protein SCHCODRAFT_02550664 [Schizophyllum commune H4-8]|nr:uncharacterized protein SCHCODRAFT_02550664 [Schizophyllum commune H4-8]KAI5888200.1 hypothetical protein SCHCODRAFT_02550664 [Schizophyllum commune H4-8]
MSAMTHDIGTLATTAAGQYQHFIQFCIQWSSIALLYYDYLLTLADERKLIWSQTLGVTTVLYVLCRYALVANVLYLLAIAHLIDKPVIVVGSLIPPPAAMPPTLVSRLLACLGESQSSVRVPGQHEPGSFGTESRLSSSSSVLWSSDVRLSIATTLPEYAALALLLILSDKALSIMVVVFEFISTALMAYRCFPAVREQRRMRAAGAFQRPLLVAVFQQGKWILAVALLFADGQAGLFYYCAVSLFTVTALILNYAAPKGFFQRLLNAFTLPISGLLTARFILHLRTIAGQDVIKSHVEPDESVVMSRMDFNDQNATQASYVYQSRTFGDVGDGDEAATGREVAVSCGEDRPRSSTFPVSEDKKGKGKSVSSIPAIV